MFAFSFSSNAQDFAGVKTSGYINGRYWSTLSLDAKATYLIAIGEAMTEVVAYAPKNCGCILDATIAALGALSGGTSSSYLEISESLDLFYKEPANRPIPVIKALTYVTLKLKGGTSRELDDLVSKLRKEANL
jgi:hypothetical protein